jgi:outer membrane protein TolC
VELKLQVPLGNRTAMAQHAEATLRQLETGANLRVQREHIAAEIRDAIRETQAASKRLDASRETTTFVTDQLDGMRRQLEAGLASSYDVLHAFDELDRARTAELRAVMEFNVGLSKIRLAEASGLERYNIELAPLPRYTFDGGNKIQ